MSTRPLASPVDTSEFRTRAGAALDRVISGERLVILRHGRPIAAIVPVLDLCDCPAHPGNLDRAPGHLAGCPAVTFRGA